MSNENGLRMLSDPIVSDENVMSKAELSANIFSRRSK